MKTLRARFLVENLDLEQATGIEDARWEHFQLAHLNDNSKFRIENKSRQIAWSWLSAAEAVANGILHQRSSVFQSMNLNEATEKIIYCKRIISALPPNMIPAITRDTRQEIELNNNCRIISLSGRPQRGKAQMNIYIDEAAHIQHDREVYKAILPMITKGGGVVRIGSSPAGQGGLFWEIFNGHKGKYKGYTRKITPWWEIFAFCKDPYGARYYAPDMDTKTRVERYGKPTIVEIFENMVLEDFQQEYEAEFADESNAWITWEEIKAIQSNDLHYRHITTSGANVNKALSAITDISRDIQSGKCESVLFGGVDVGRTRNLTEIFLVGINSSYHLPVRLMLSLHNCQFNDQLSIITKIIKTLPIAGLYIDKNGLGMNLAENLSLAFPQKVGGFQFSMQSKAVLATDAKMLIQQRRVIIPNDDDLGYQLHSLKKKQTAAGNTVFDTDKAEKHHADKFWALALALHIAKSLTMQRTKQEKVNVYDDFYEISPF